MATKVFAESPNMPSMEVLAAQGVKNTKQPLPMAPRVKHKANGRIFTWHPIFAERSDAFVCCDENGNEDPAAWAGRGPYGSTVVPPPDSPAQKKIFEHPKAVKTLAAPAPAAAPAALDALFRNFPEAPAPAAVSEEAVFIPPKI